MSIIERIHVLVKAQGLTIKQVERECGLANATIRRWSTQTPNIESVRRVAQRLDVTIDYLVTGSTTGTSPVDPSGGGVVLSVEESDLVAMFREFPGETQGEIIDFVRFKHIQYFGKV